jgi:hypothetical protein
MKYSSSLRWFTNVRWDDRDCFIDCLVDITTLDIKSGYLLIQVDRQLKIYSCEEYRNEFPHRSLKILGQVKKRVVNLIK